MTDKYDKNGYNSSDFKRNSNQEQADFDGTQDGGDTSVKLNERADEYIRELLSEKIKLNNVKFPISSNLIDQEVTKVQSTGNIPRKESKYVDVNHERPVKVVVKVLVPVKEHPKFNFVGKLLGPKGNTMKQLQEETMCKMAVLGRGSMRDRQKEEELRNSLDPKYSHLTEELHVEISALAAPAEAHARIAYGLAAVKKYLIPDPVDVFRQGPVMMERDVGPAKRPPLLQNPDQGRMDIAYSACTITKRSFSYQGPVTVGNIGGAGPRGGVPPHHGGGRAPPRMPPAPPPPMARQMPGGKSKVISILDRARSAMDSYPPYDDPYAPPDPQVRGPPRAAPEQDFYYDPHSHERYYEEEPYYKDDSREFKSAREVGTRRPHAQHAPQRQYQHRASPYARPAK